MALVRCIDWETAADGMPRGLTSGGGRWLSAIFGILAPVIFAGAGEPIPPGEALLSGPMARRFLQGPMRGVEEIIFAVRVPGRDHWYVNFGNYSDHSHYPKNLAYKEADGVLWGYGDGAQLCRLNLRTGAVKVLLEDPDGGIRDPQVNYEGDKILFSYRRGGTHTYHLCEMRADGSAFRQLTSGPDDDYEPTYLPDGRIMFVSSRCRRFVNCWYSRVGTLYGCDGDGRGVRMVSSSNEHDNTPWPLPDGRVLYMRWEYVDRSQLDYHHLWTVNQDGTGQMVHYGNMNPGMAMLDAKPIPNPAGDTGPWRGKVVSIFSPGHGRPEHRGHIAVLDTLAGPDDANRSRAITKGRPDFRDPYPLAEDAFLAADERGIILVDGAGETELIYRLTPHKRQQPLLLHEPRPMVGRPRENIIAPRWDAARPEGQLMLADVRAGRNMAGVARGEIARLLVLEQLPKPVNFSGGMEPLTIGGSFTLARILGTVPVEKDGSANFTVPALRSVFFVALDKDDLAVKRMHSFLTMQPGEVTGCVGCHEPRTQTPLSSFGTMAAMRRSPSRIEPISGVPDVLDFPRDIQPILDRHCVSCHNPERYDGRLDLCGDHTPQHSAAYYAMRRHGLVADNRNQPKSNLAPRALGSSASKLMRYLDGSHYKATLSAEERRLVRLWIDTSATYPGTYAALGSGTVYAGLNALGARCASCHLREGEPHQGKPTKRWVFGGKTAPAATDPQSLCNLDRPELSVLLRAPMAKAAGGLGLCGGTVFADASDPDYRAMLERIRAAGAELKRVGRFDMPGFQPNEHYLREMRRFGIIDPKANPGVPVDPYAIDQRYWRSFWYDPAKISTAGLARTIP